LDLSEGLKGCLLSKSKWEVKRYGSHPLIFGKHILSYALKFIEVVAYCLFFYASLNPLVELFACQASLLAYAFLFGLVEALHLGLNTLENFWLKFALCLKHAKQ